jgi:hypothetical protein
LPIPQLDGEIDIELRPGRSGTKTRRDGTFVVGAGIRVQGRLKFNGSSPYTLDDPESIKQMMDNLELKEESRSTTTQQVINKHRSKESKLTTKLLNNMIKEEIYRRVDK